MNQGRGMCQPVHETTNTSQGVHHSPTVKHNAPPAAYLAHELLCEQQLGVRSPGLP